MTEANTKKWNGEIWRKILNSVADKYDCGVRFTNQEGQLSYVGDKACAAEIVKETMAIMAGETL